VAKYDPSEYKSQVKPYHTPASDKQWTIFTAIVEVLNRKREEEKRKLAERQGKGWTPKINGILKAILAGETAYFVTLLVLMFT